MATLDGSPCMDSPTRHVSPSRRPGVRNALGVALVCGLVGLTGGAALFLGWAWRQYGSPRAAIAMLWGETTLVEPLRIDIGIRPPGDSVRVTLQVWNLSGEPFTLNGLAGQCGQGGCVSTTEPMPRVIGGWGSHPLNLDVQAPALPDRAMRLESAIYTSRGAFDLEITGMSGSLGPSDAPQVGP